MAAAAPKTIEEIEAQIKAIQAQKAGLAPLDENGEGVPLAASDGAYMDEDIYGGTKNRFDGYVTRLRQMTMQMLMMMIMKQLP
ncbi:splicing factor 3B subunit 1-like [Tachypleus tridentatus]|uniref:splicing factor 3B subunit 1-like n=1 Tax=Tachypleus tridentatus TaxID=6853 RepID=UPI003FCF1E6F